MEARQQRLVVLVFVLAVCTVIAVALMNFFHIIA